MPTTPLVFNTTFWQPPSHARSCQPLHRSKQLSHIALLYPTPVPQGFSSALARHLCFRLSVPLNRHSRLGGSFAVRAHVVLDIAWSVKKKLHNHWQLHHDPATQSSHRVTSKERENETCRGPNPCIDAVPPPNRLSSRWHVSQCTIKQAIRSKVCNNGPSC